MNELLDEQIRLHFGDDYDSVTKRANQYLGQLKKNHLSWGRSLKQLINNEGVDIISTMLCYVIEVGDLEDGLTRWARDISAEYINGAHNKWVPFVEGRANRGRRKGQEGFSRLDQLLDHPPIERREMQPDSLSERLHLSSSGDLAQADFLKTSEERELYQVLASVKSHKDAANYLNWSLEKVKRIYKRVHRRQRYATNSDFRQRMLDKSAEEWVEKSRKK